MKTWLSGAGAAGCLVTALASIGTDAAMHAMDVLLERVFTIAGGYADHPY